MVLYFHHLQYIKHVFKCAFFSKAVNARYEEHVLNCGDFDERVFLEPNADAEIGTPAKHGAYNPGDLQEQMRVNQVRQSIVEV